MIDTGATLAGEAFGLRRDRLFERLEGGVLVLPAAPELARSDGGEVRYRPDPELFYLTGAQDPGIVAVFQGGEDRRFLLFVPEADPTTALWSGPRMGPEEAKEALGADEAFPLSALENELPGILRSHHTAGFRLGSEDRVEAVLRDGLAWSRRRGARKGDGVRCIVDPGEFLDDLRLRKGPEEIAAIRKATALTVAAFEMAIAAAGPGVGEWEVEASFEGAIRSGGGSGPAFPTIVGSGPNACVLHYVRNASRIEGDAMILLDGGAEVEMYAGDITRTFPASGTASTPQLEVYELVRKAQTSAVSACRPGVPVSDVHDAARKVLGQGLRALGVMDSDPGSEEGQAVLDRFFPHRTSHWLGLSVHDAGAYQGREGPTILEPGMVLTVEPGLYFPPATEGAGAAFGGIGVRIEDDVLITEGGSENLTAALGVEPGDWPDTVGARR